MQNRQLSVLATAWAAWSRARRWSATARPWQRDDVDLKLLTISAPFAGIGIAEHCGYKAAQWLSLGIVPGICKAITGDNWYEITSASEFIRQPGPLLPTVQRFLKVVTDERDTCRCGMKAAAVSRATMSSAWANNTSRWWTALRSWSMWRSTPATSRLSVTKHGSAQAAGDPARTGMLAPTPPERRAALERLLVELY